MIFYHAITPYQILCAAVHRLLTYQTEKAILVIGDEVDGITDCIRLQEFGVFYRVLFYPYNQINLTQEKKLILATAREVYSRYIPFKRNSFKDLYILGAAYSPLALLFIEDKVPVHFFEESSGIMSKWEYLSNVLINLYTASWDKIAREYGLYDGNNELFLTILCDVKAQTKTIDDPRVVDFNIADKLQHLPKEALDKLLKGMFELGKQAVQAHSAVILTQQFENLQVLSRENQILIYQVLINYFLEGYNIIFKLHPYDKISYEEFFESCKSIIGKFPAELLPYIFAARPEAIATVSSTCTSNIKNYFNKAIELNNDFECMFLSTHKYYACLKSLDEKTEEKECFTAGCNQALIDNLCLFNDIAIKERIFTKLPSEFGNISNKTIIIDDIKKSELDYDNIAILEKNKNTIIFIGQDKPKSKDSEYLRLELQKKPLREKNVFNSLDPEWIYIHSPDIVFIKHLKAKQIHKRLEIIGIEIMINPVIE